MAGANLWEDLETGPDAPEEIYAVEIGRAHV